MDLRSFINAREIALYIKNLPQSTNIDQALFPVDKQMGTEIELAKGAKKRPVALRMSTFDVAAKVRALSADVNLEKKEMPFFKEAIGIKESDRRKLIEAMTANNQNIVNFLLSAVFNNYTSLVEGADVQVTRMRAQLMQKGEINIITKDGDIVVDYGIPAAHKEVLSGTGLWTNPAADIVGDIKRWQKKFTDEGLEKPTRMLLTERTFVNTICVNTAITNELRSRVLGEVIVTDEDYISFMKKKLGIEIAFLGGVYLNEEGASGNFYEDNKVSLIPKGTLGKTIYGMTPEEFDKAYGSGKLDTEIVKTGIAITTMVKEDPVSVDTKVSQIVIPSFERADECFFAVVSELA